MRRSRFDRPARVELLPLIDVVFLLLAVFLYSMVAMVRSHVIPVSLPPLATGEASGFSTVLVISIESNGRLSVGGDEVAPDGLAPLLRELRESDTELAVLINADQNATHGAVTKVYDTLRLVGQERVFLVGQPE